MGYLYHKWPRICSTSRFVPYLWLITGFVTRLTRRVSLVDQELPTYPEHMIFSFMCWYCTLLFVPCCSFSFAQYVVCFSSIYGFWMPLWYLPTLFSSVITYRLASYILRWLLCFESTEINFNFLFARRRMVSVNIHIYTYTRRMPQVEQELSTFPEHLRSIPVLAGFVLLNMSFSM
jgi:hypothetical protein